MPQHYKVGGKPAQPAVALLPGRASIAVLIGIHRLLPRQPAGLRHSRELFLLWQG